MKKTLTILLAAALCQFSLAEEVKIEIQSNDQMQYDVKAFTVKEGDEVVLTLKHTGKLPAMAMGHNLVILKPGTDMGAFAAKCAPARENEFIPTDDASKAMIVAHTKILGGGEQDVVTFTAPAAGTYPFLCSFPGHWAIMQGEMTVTAK